MDIQIIEDADGVMFRTLKRIYFRMNGKRYSIPKGFVSDGASVPRFLWRLLDPSITSKTLVPSIKHDWLYQNKPCTRNEADKYYRDALVKNNYPKWKANLMYTGLVLFGWTHWK